MKVCKFIFYRPRDLENWSLIKKIWSKQTLHNIYVKLIDWLIRFDARLINLVINLSVLVADWLFIFTKIHSEYNIYDSSSIDFDQSANLSNLTVVFTTLLTLIVIFIVDIIFCNQITCTNASIFLCLYFLIC